MIEDGLLDKDYYAAEKDYTSAILHGIVKIASKMGVSTIQSYQGSQIFEAIGISQEVIDHYFTGTISRVGGVGLKEIQADVHALHDKAFDPLELYTDESVESVGLHKYRAGKERHLYSPMVIHLLQRSAMTGDYEKYREYAKLVNDPGNIVNLRGAMEIRFPEGAEIPIDEVESVETIVKRFQTGAMSFGSLSQEAHECMAIAMNSIGRQVQHRRGRRAGLPVYHWPGRAQQKFCRQAGGLRPLRRGLQVSGLRQRDPDQDGPGCKARRGRQPAWQEGLSMGSKDPLFYTGRLSDLPAASSRYLPHLRTWHS